MCVVKTLTHFAILLTALTILPYEAHAAGILSVDAATHRLTTVLHPSLAQSGQNMVWSPLNMRDLLCMAAHGARGRTRQEFDSLLALDSTAAWASEMSLSRTQLYSRLVSSVQIYGSGRAWVFGGDPIFRPEYERDLRDIFGASILRTASVGDVSAIVDRWVSEKTRGHIQTMGFKPPKDAISYACLLAAVYMQGNWHHKFPEEKTTAKNFTNENGKVSHVMTMAQEDEFFYSEDEMVQTLRMDFGAGDVAMTILLPRGTSKLVDIEAQIGSRKFASWLNAQRTFDVNVMLPRFRITSDFDNMKLRLVDAGLSSLRDGASQDFSGISALSPGREFFVGQIIHKAGIEVNETGAKAWAASGMSFVGMEGGAPRPPYREFHANHPFLFVIHADRPFIPLFVGRVASL